MTYSEEQKLILAGFLIGVVFTLVGFYMLKPEAPKQPEPVAQSVAQQVEKHGTFTVVSEYKGCDLVQWQYGMLSEYKYFLHCPK
jgi:hypothetical protein